MQQAREAVEKFSIKGAIESVALFGGGHINDTFLVKTSEDLYLLQKVNTAVFQQPDVLEKNLEQLFQLNSQIFVKHLRTKDGRWLLRDKSGVWKMQRYDRHTYAPQTADNSRQVGQIAKGFGQFTKLGLELSPRAFREAIPDFHNLSWRLRQLDEAISKDKAGRKEKACALIAKANSFRSIRDHISALIAQGLPQRLCHNDTKIDNILLSLGSHDFRYVIDLDTVGPGYVLYDFGDMMRTMLSPTKEAEVDETKIALSEASYRAIRQSYLNECGDQLSALELDSLSFGGQYMTYLMGIRFLADYLNGDTYYKVSHPQENFIRARNQLKILELMREMIS